MFPGMIFLLAASAALAVASPDGRLIFTLRVNPQGELRYAAAFGKQPLVEDSAAGLTVDGAKLGQGVALGKAHRYRVNETYPWRGVHSTAVNRANAATVSLQAGQLNYQVEVRVFNDGFGFRFLVPGAGHRVPDEATSFVLPEGSTVWYHGFEGHYEGVHARKNIAEVPEGDWAAPPLTYRLPGGAGYGAITEAALTAYSGMALQADGQRGFRARLGHAPPPSRPFTLRFAEDVERLSHPAAVEGTIRTPWRVVLAGRDLNELVNSGVIHNLAADGRAVGI